MPAFFFFFVQCRLTDVFLISYKTKTSVRMWEACKLCGPLHLIAMTVAFKNKLISLARNHSV